MITVSLSITPNGIQLYAKSPVIANFMKSHSRLRENIFGIQYYELEEFYFENASIRRSLDPINRKIIHRDIPNLGFLLHPDLETGYTHLYDQVMTKPDYLRFVKRLEYFLSLAIREIKPRVLITVKEIIE